MIGPKIESESTKVKHASRGFFSKLFDLGSSFIPEEEEKDDVDDLVSDAIDTLG